MQQLDGCTAAIMNPIEGEQKPGGQPFRAVQKAISTVPPHCLCVHVCVLEYAHGPVQLKQRISKRMEWSTALRIAFRRS